MMPEILICLDDLRSIVNHLLQSADQLQDYRARLDGDYNSPQALKNYELIETLRQRYSI